jgi:hypothetical protein
MNQTNIESVEYKNRELTFWNLDILKSDLLEFKCGYIEDRTRQIYENRKISRRVDEVEEKINNLVTKIMAIERMFLDVRAFVESKLTNSSDKVANICHKCNGYGHRDFSGLDCEVCSGKGIVWK